MAVAVVASVEAEAVASAAAEEAVASEAAEGSEVVVVDTEMDHFSNEHMQMN